MKRIYIKEDSIIVENEEDIITGELADMSDVEHALCCGFNLEYNIVHEIAQGYLCISYDADTCDLDYLLVKK
jgi:hypothetical protein